MSEMSFLPAPRVSVEVARTLANRAEERMLAPARTGGFELQSVGISALPNGQEIIRTDRGSLWVVADHRIDPTARRFSGNVDIPDAHLAHLAALDKLGVRPEFVVIAHELPASYKEGESIPQLVPPPRHLREKDERLQLRLQRITTPFLAGAQKLMGATAALFALLPELAVGLDPVVLGGVKHPELPVVQWCVLAEWEWE